MQPIWNEPALVLDRTLEGRTHRYLVASELHIGIENELARRGAFLKSRTPGLAGEILRLAKENAATRLILLGDVKHRVTHLTPQELRDLPAFFGRLASFEEVHIALGNHDAGLRSMLPKERFPNVVVHPATGFVLEDDKRSVACLHGHAWPKDALLDAKLFLVGHTHVAASFVDETGQPRTERAWLRGRLEPSQVEKRYGRAAAPEVVVFPPFNPICGGTAVNHEGLLGPFSQLVDLPSARLYALDGRALGPIADLAAEKPSKRRRPIGST